MQRRRALSDAASSFFQSLAANRPLQVGMGAATFAIGRGVAALLRGEKPARALEQVGGFALDLGASVGFGAYLANSDGGVSLQYDIPDVESPGGGDLDAVRAGFFLPPLPPVGRPPSPSAPARPVVAPAYVPERAPAPESVPERASAPERAPQRAPTSRGGPVPNPEDRSPSRVPLPVATSPEVSSPRARTRARAAPADGRPTGRVGTPGAGGRVPSGFTATEAVGALAGGVGAAPTVVRHAGALARASERAARAFGRGARA